MPSAATSGNAVRVKTVVAIVVVLGVLWAIGSALTKSDDEAGSGASALACSSFREAARDYAAGKLTLAELRRELQDVDDDAEVSTPAIAAASSEMLRAITAGDLDALSAAVPRMTSACSASGN